MTLNRGSFLKTAGLADGDWAPVDLRTFESTRHPFIHVLGDASVAGALPKSGYTANAEAKT
jgi:sulfide dehydrogenase [flavocytochrome c] flavoprotein subunit